LADAAGGVCGLAGCLAAGVAAVARRSLALAIIALSSLLGTPRPALLTDRTGLRPDPRLARHPANPQTPPAFETLRHP